MKNMKKTLCLLLAVLMTVSLLAGCGKKVDDNADSKKVFTVASMPSILPSATWAMTAATPALTLRLPRRPAISWAGR